ncbi:hypothetical protein LOTGIDRAFT_229481 [Lottia gigantea]|uniref:Methionine--tRNA ligase, cytoplasmic n=1 Tax=Lottia gigantea TaxID=225164 RepID=V3ZMX5_LOTGI|nr:hypothetical protein LOTGIDRAFT_229481 [Lottia gigantea]ESO85667.1 hypothetical protein LOTGIDRAFT_229481 [Lottia gigantea]
MKVITDRGNFQTVKILIAAKAQTAGSGSGTDLKVTEVKHGEKVVPYLTESKLPVLEVKPEKFLFSVNSAVRLLLTSTGIESDSKQIDEWLEWESSQLLPYVFPVLVNHIGHNKTDKQSDSLLQPLLTYLNTSVKNKTYLVGDSLTSADVCVFGTVYPLTSTPILKGFPELTSWIEKLSLIDAFKEAISIVTQNKGPVVFKESLLSQPAMPSPDSLTSKSTSKSSSVSSQPTESSEVEKQLTEEELNAAEKCWRDGVAKLPELRERKHPILPIKGEKNILICSALPYVNNVPHLGNIIGCVLSADVYSRYCRLRNYNSVYLCGTDEYGTATENKALEEGLTPQEICDKYNKLHTEIYDWFNISFDHFGRTTTTEQTKIVQDIFWKVYNNGHVIKDSIDQLHCDKCNRFLADRFLADRFLAGRFLADRFVSGICPMCSYDDARGDQCDGCGKLINAVELINPKCKSCTSTPTVKTTQHLFLDLPKLEPELRQHLDKAFDNGLWTHNSKVITNSWIRDGLKPRCITRDLKWGIPVPLEGYTDKVFYVWFDAPIGYISITATYTKDWEKWWKNPNEVELFNFLGKDNVPFHSVIFPCTLLGANDNFTLVKHMSATEYLNYEDTKFSKSRGVGVFGNNAKDTGIPADVFRFYLLFVRPESQDTAFSWDDFLLKNNSELLNNLGNFINRLRDSIRNILSISRLGNQMMQANKPWVLVKRTPDEKARAGSVVSLAANIAWLIGVLLQPYMPSTSEIICTQLNGNPKNMVIPTQFIPVLKTGHKIGKPSPLFQKIEASLIEEMKKKFQGKQEKSVPAKPEVKSAPANSVLPKASDSEIASITDQVTKQGEVVRELKTQKAEKSKIDKEVALLLDLKKKLSLAQGIDPATASSNKKKGKKK